MSEVKPELAPSSEGRGRRTRFLICLILVGATLLVYWQVPWLGFVNFDDPADVSENPHTLAGLTGSGLAWGFLTVQGQDYWRPLTRVSLMLDTEIGGPAPRIYHLTNLLLHIVDTLLLFLLLFTMTGSTWRSALVALLFAVHPLHVESVAWITERKDVLSMLFWLLTAMAYVRYVRTGGWGRYALVLLGLSAGLMSKPTVVTLPVVLLLFDFWPLGRFREGPSRLGAAIRLVMEKVPMLVLAALLSAITIVTHAAAKSVGSLDQYPLDVRLATSAVGYVRYIFKMFWPSGLAFFYPYPREGPPVLEILGAGLLLACVTISAVLLLRRAPYVLCGWLFFLVTLLPMIGILQVGNQSMADRYSYIPFTGLFVLIVWGLADLTGGWRRRESGSDRSGIAPEAAQEQQLSAQHGAPAFNPSSSMVGSSPLAGSQGHGAAPSLSAHGVPGRAGEVRTGRVALLGAVAGVGIAALMICASIQVGTWRDSITLCSHALAVTEANPFAHTNLGEALSREGRIDEAIPHFREAIRIDPGMLQPRANLVLARIKQGDYEEASREASDLLGRRPDDPDAHQMMGRALAKQGRRGEAVEQLREALRLRPDDVESLMHLGSVLAEMGNYEEAAARFTDVLRIAPGHAAARHLLERTKAHRR